MLSTLGELELACIDQMNRQDVVGAIRARGDCLPADLQERLEEQSTEHLRLLLLAGRLIHALRHLRNRR